LRPISCRDPRGPISAPLCDLTTVRSGVTGPAVQPMSLNKGKVRSCGGATSCVRSPLMAGSMSWLGNIAVLKWDTEDPCTKLGGAYIMPRPCGSAPVKVDPEGC